MHSHTLNNTHTNTPIHKQYTNRQVYILTLLIDTVNEQTLSFKG